MADSRTTSGDIVQKVEDTIQRQGLLRPADRIVIGVSGGPDSVALLRILVQLAGEWKWDLSVAHLHHGLRGRDADEDLAFVNEMASELGLPFFHRTLPRGALNRVRGSLQEAARCSRYTFLEEVRLLWKGDRIALGHQADDQAETVLWALMRGAGTQGLRGIPYKRGDVIVRPLLDLTRWEILRFLEACSLPFKSDPSNEEMAYRRNQIRHMLLPILRERFNPRIDDLLRRTARICAYENAFLESQVDTIWQSVSKTTEGLVEIPLDAFRRHPTALRLRVLRRAYAHLRGQTRGLSLRQLEALDRLSKGDGQERWFHLPEGVRAVVGGKTMVIGWARALEQGGLYYAVTCPGETVVPEANLQIRWDVLDEGPPAGWRQAREAVFMDLDQIRGSLALRGWQPGDRLRPLGLGGSRKIQDILIDDHVPRRDRWRVPLLVDEQGVVWVVGHRMDERVGLRPTTKRLLKAVVLPLDAHITS